MMKIIIEHHFAGIPKGRRSYRFFLGSDHLKSIYIYIYEIISKLY